MNRLKDWQGMTVTGQLGRTTTQQQNMFSRPEH